MAQSFIFKIIHEEGQWVTHGISQSLLQGIFWVLWEPINAGEQVCFTCMHLIHSYLAPEETDLQGDGIV